MTRRAIGRLGLALLALGTGLLAQPTSVGAANASKSAWWYRPSDPASLVPDAAAPPAPVPAAPADAPAPPTVAEGELLVQGTPEGATAIAAITYTLADGESSPVLTVTPSESSSVPPEAVVLACRAAVGWTTPEANPGRWQDKPLVDCGRSVNGIVGEDGTITFALQPLISGTDLDVVLVPGVVGETPAGPVGSSFTLAFGATDGAVLQTTGSSSGWGDTPTNVAPPSSGSSSFTPPGGSSFTPPAAPIVAPALEPQEQAPSVPDQPALAATPVAAEEDTTGRGVAIIILLAGAALAAFASLTPDRPEKGAVGLGRFRRPAPAGALQPALAPVDGGLGRFVRPRTGAPPKLS